MTKRAADVGEFCWFNLMTPEVKKAKEFFSKIFRWSYDEIPNVGYIAKVGGEHVGGVFDVVSPKTPNGMDPMIGVMIKTDNVDATVKKIKALGGKAQDPFDVMENGRMAVCADINGAEFDLWQAKGQQGTGFDADSHGAPGWYETRTSDVKRAGKFYHDLFGWVAEAMPGQKQGPKYSVFKLKDRQIGGMCGITKEMGAMKPNWTIFYTVDDADKTAQEVTKLGGSIVFQPTDVPTVGRFAVLKSPQGVVFHVIKYTGLRV